MADLNALIAQGAQFAKPIDPFAQYAQMQQLEQGQQANALNRMKMDEYQRGLQEQNALRTAIRPDFDPTNAAHVAAIYQAAPTLAPKFVESALTAKKTGVDIDKDRAAMVKTQIDNSREMLVGINDQAGYDAWRATTLKQLPQLEGSIPTVFNPQVKKDLIVKADDLSKQLTLPLHFGTTGGMTNVGFNQVTGQQVTHGVAATATPGELLTKQSADERNRIAAGQLAVSQGQLQVARDRLAKENVQLDPIEQQVMAKAIVEGRVDINKVNSRNAKMYVAALQSQPGIDLREMSFENLGAAAGARALGTQSAKMSTAANEADKMIDVVRSTSAAVDRTQFPTINAVQNAVDKGTGGKEIVQLNTAINSLVNSYARAISPTGQPTVSDKNHAREVINSAYSNGQIEAITDIMRQEMSIAQGATKKAGESAKAERKGTPAAPATSKSGATVSNW